MESSTEHNTEPQELLAIGEAAEYLNVSAQTLRRWDKQGKLSPLRLKTNGYRRYTKEQLDSALQVQ